MFRSSWRYVRSLHELLAQFGKATRMTVRQLALTVRGKTVVRVTVPTFQVAGHGRSHSVGAIKLSNIFSTYGVDAPLGLRDPEFHRRQVHKRYPRRTPTGLSLISAHLSLTSRMYSRRRSLRASLREYFIYIHLRSYWHFIRQHNVRHHFQ